MFVTLPHYSHEEGVKAVVVVNTQHIQTIYEVEKKFEYGPTVYCRIEFLGSNKSCLSSLLIPMSLLDLMKLLREAK